MRFAFSLIFVYYFVLIAQILVVFYMMKYKFNIVEALKENGYNTNYIRLNKVLSEATMTKFRKNDTSITIDNLERLCKLLNCQPGDILEYVPDTPDTTNQDL